MTQLNFQWELLAPEFILVGWAGALVLLDLFWGSSAGLRTGRIGKEPLGYLAAAGAVAAALVSLFWIGDHKNFADLIDVNNYTTLFRVFFGLTAAFACIASARYVKDRLLHPGEYYALILLSVVGANGMAAASELLTAYISLELLSFSLYVLASYDKFDLRSNEGGLKYMLLGAFSSAIFLYGISLVYGVTGSTHFNAIGEVLKGDTSDIDMALLLGLALMIGGLGFKVAAVPFHMWTPDAYEGAPLPITALISALSKSAGFALFLKLFTQAFLPLIDDWRYFIAALSVATMALGNLVAIQQQNLKRLLAYSSIGQVGYLLMGIAALSPESASALVLHMIGYVVTNLAVFVCIIIYYNWTGKEEIKDYAGTAERAPFLALCLSIALFSLAGMPLFAGFATKFILFQSAAQEDLLWLAGVAVFFSFVSLYYYLLIVKEMYLGEPAERTRFPTPWLEYGALSLLVAGVMFVGLYPQPVYDAVEDSTATIFAAVEDSAAVSERP
ncbi:MAG: NADH-quinone oxidoreductase subunit N [Dehalococcoidia bacterium]|nr:NADH-quinone oxidoreductase subunit N [Dehalococcoidia bacterium]